MFFSKNKKNKFNIEMHGYENGKEVPLKIYKDDNDVGGAVDFALALKNSIKPYEDNLVAFATSLNRKIPVDEEISLLKGLIEAYNDLESKCRSMGPKFSKYFTEIWENARAGKPDGPGYIDRYQKRLNYIEENYAEIKSNEEKRNINIIGLESKLLKCLSEHPNTLQKDIYQYFDITVKEDIKEYLYRMEKQGKITRKKSGSSYLVNLAK